MKYRIHKKIAFVAILISLVFVVTNVYAKKPAKPPRDQDEPKTECIIFSNDLEGSEIVEDCCPNDGPFPVYGLTLLGTPYVGELFINNYGAGRNHGYIVQFWNDDVWFEIKGGEVVNERKNKVLTVFFDEEPATLLEYGADNSQSVSFDLLRTADLGDCP